MVLQEVYCHLQAVTITYIIMFPFLLHIQDFTHDIKEKTNVTPNSHMEARNCNLDGELSSLIHNPALSPHCLISSSCQISSSAGQILFMIEKLVHQHTVHRHYNMLTVCCGQNRLPGSTSLSPSLSSPSPDAPSLPFCLLMYIILHIISDQLNAQLNESLNISQKDVQLFSYDSVIHCLKSMSLKSFP